MIFEMVIPLFLIGPIIVLILLFLGFLFRRIFKIKKQSSGIIAYGIFLILFTLILSGNVVSVVKQDISYLKKDTVLVLRPGHLNKEEVPRTKEYEKEILDEIPYMIRDFAVMLAIITIFIILTVGIFKLKNWARVMCLWFSVLFSILCFICNTDFSNDWNPLKLYSAEAFLYWIYPIIIFVPTVIFLTQRKVKEQFK